MMTAADAGTARIDSSSLRGRVSSHPLARHRAVRSLVQTGSGDVGQGQEGVGLLAMRGVTASRETGDPNAIEEPGERLGV
jgi:hypothetical protein